MSFSFSRVLVGFIKQWQIKTFNVQETFVTFEFSLIACYKKTHLHLRKELCSNLIISISFQPDGLNLVYFNINGLRRVENENEN